MLSEKDVQYVKNRYIARIDQCGVTFESLNSGDIKKQNIRCKIHSAAILKENSTVLDIGCGLGYFYQYLTDHGIICNYSGYDIVPAYIEECKRLYPEAEFECRNIFNEGIEGTYDTIILSQVLNNRYRFSDNERVMQQALTLAYRHSKVSVSVDMMSKYVDFEDPELYYYSPEEIFRFAKTLCRRTLLRHDFRSFEFCIQMIHGDFGDFVK